jgi:hypothetical protein
MSSDFRLLVDSAYGNSTDPATNNTFVRYNYDFSTHKKGVYELTYTYTGAAGNIFANQPDVAEIRITEFALLNNRRIKRNNFETSQIIGVTIPQFLNTTTFKGYLYADLNTNTKSLLYLPSTNNFTVQIVNYVGNGWLDTGATPAENFGYLLVLYFKYLGE